MIKSFVKESQKEEEEGIEHHFTTKYEAVSIRRQKREEIFRKRRMPDIDPLTIFNDPFAELVEEYSKEEFFLDQVPRLLD